MNNEEKGKNESNLPKMDLESGNWRLFPDDHFSDAACATECTGLIREVPLDDDAAEAYESIYSYRQNKPIVKEE